MKRDLVFAVLASVIALLATNYYYSHRDVKDVFTVSTDQVDTIPEPELKFGIPVDSFTIGKNCIKWNQNIASILSEYNIPYTIINKIPDAAKDIMDIRKIKAGNNYFTFCRKDTAAALQYFVYEHSPRDYFVFDFSDTLSIWKGQKEVTTEVRKDAGIIETSLWECMIDHDINPMVAIELSEIFAWTVDFFRLGKGDYFKVIYDEQFVDSTSIGVGEIHAALFNHMGETIFAVPFVQDSSLSYYDLEGNSLQREFLKAPLRFSRISSGFSYRRLHPILHVRRPHLGIDYAAAYGTPVHAIGDGVVTRVAYTRGGGRTLKIRHNSVYTTGYLHLSKYGKGIKTGVRVKQGQVIGYVGSTGMSTGPHLDFRFWKNGHPVNPLNVKAPPVKPIKEVYKIAYDSVKYIVVNKLEKIEVPGIEKKDNTGNLQAASGL